MTTPQPSPYGTVAPPDPISDALPPGHERCPCGQPVKPWFRGRGVGHAIWFGGVSPLITLAVYALIVALALSEEVARTPGATAVFLGLLPLIYLVMLIVLAAAAKHRGLCLLRRSLVWFAVWPGATISAVLAALS